LLSNAATYQADLDGDYWPALAVAYGEFVADVRIRVHQRQVDLLQSPIRRSYLRRLRERTQPTGRGPSRKDRVRASTAGEKAHRWAATAGRHSSET
jgi:hypothetical protein